MTKTTNDFDGSRTWNLADRIEISDQMSNACLVELIGENNGVDELLQRCIGQALFICVGAYFVHKAGRLCRPLFCRDTCSCSLSLASFRS